MFPSLTFVACTLLMYGVYTVDAQAFKRCVDRLTADLTNGTETCKAMTEYVKCIILQTNLYKEPNKNETMRQFKTEFERGLAEKNINCDIDVVAIADELLENDRKGIQQTTTQPKGYKLSKTVGECIDTYTAELSGGVTCAKITDYLKCVFRVSNLQNLTSNITGDDKQTLEQTLKNSLNQTHLECDINVSALIDEVRWEEAGENGNEQQQGNGNNGTATIVTLIPFVTLLIFTIASMIVLR
ncbi:hypothetical protein BsWGS_25292 [Bradybaena similaris]